MFFLPYYAIFGWCDLYSWKYSIYIYVARAKTLLCHLNRNTTFVLYYIYCFLHKKMNNQKVPSLTDLVTPGGPSVPPAEDFYQSPSPIWKLNTKPWYHYRQPAWQPSLSESTAEEKRRDEDNFTLIKLKKTLDLTSELWFITAKWY